MLLKTKNKSDQRSQSGANAVEYALVMALIVGMMLTAASIMRQPIGGYFDDAAQCVSQLLSGGSCGSTDDRVRSAEGEDDSGGIFGKIWDGITWTAGKIWDGITWTAGKIWDGITWVGDKIGIGDTNKPIDNTVADDTESLDPTDPRRNGDQGFESIDNAAIAFGIEHGPDSVNNDEERATLIYRDEHGNYHYAPNPDISPCATGAPCSSNPWAVESQIPNGAELVGDVHSHGANPPDNPNAFDNFSPGDFRGIDSDAANHGGVWSGYLINPSGDILYYEGGSGNPPTVIGRWDS